MTLSEIELTLTELVSRHPNLDIELLRTLLLAAGWEDKNIQEAIALFKQKGVEGLKTIQPVPLQHGETEIPLVSKELTTESSKAEITFYQPDGTEEGKLQAFTEAPSTSPQEEKRETDEHVVDHLQVEQEIMVPEQVEEQVPPPQPVEERGKEEIQIIKNDEVEIKEVPAEVEIPVKEEDIAEAKTFDDVVAQKIEDTHAEVVEQPPEPQSLVVSEPSSGVYVSKKDVQIPEDLPLLPFESSPHVWSFSKYKDTFHSDLISGVQSDVLPEVIQKEQTKVSSNPAQSQAIPHTPHHIPVEVDGEKVPMNKGDESLVFLAGIMLLAIILILGYMYSNGRL